MSLQARIIALVVGVALLIGVVSSLVTGRLLRVFLEGEHVEKAEAITATAAELISTQVVERKVLAARESLRKIVRDAPGDVEYAYVVGFEGGIFAHSFDGGFPRELAEGMPEKRGLLRYRAGEVPMLEVCDPLIEGMGAVLCVGMNETHILAHIADIRNRILSVTLGVVVLGVIMSVVLGRRITRPLDRLAEVMRTYKAGEEGPDPEIRGGSEVEVLAGSFRDMSRTIRSHMSEILESETKFRQMAENIREVFWLFDWEGQRVIYASPAYEEIWGRPVRELYDRYEAWGESVHPQDQAYAQESFARILETGGGEAREYRIIRPDGAVRWVSDRGFAIRGEDGAVRRIAGIAEDITGRKNVESSLQKLSQAVEQSPSIIEITDPQGVVEYVNPKFTQVTGYSKAETLGTSVNDRKGLPEAEEAALWETITSGREWRGVFRNRRKNGEHYWEEARISPVLDERGEITNFIKVGEDVTERRKLEDQLRHAQKMEALGTLTGGIAHEFNNIMAAILGYGEFLQGGLREGDPLRRYADLLIGSVERAARLTEGLLAYSRKHVPHTEVADVNGIVRAAEQYLSGLVREGVALKVAPTNGNLPVVADIAQLEQVLINLATNAMDAMPQGGTLGIRTERVSYEKERFENQAHIPPGDYALVTVGDTGTGMAPETMEKIFEPFFTTKEVGKGTGLGLSMVYGIIGKHHGHVSVESEVGRGTTFRLHLPLHEGEQEEREEEEVPSPEPTPGGGETVLLAEDDGAVRNLVASVLTGAGYTVIEAVDGEDAVRKFGEHRDAVELLLFDVVMPRKNGTDAYREIREMRAGVRGVFMSGYLSDDIRIQAIHDEGNPLVWKPVKSDELLRVVRKTLDAKSP